MEAGLKGGAQSAQIRETSSSDFGRRFEDRTLRVDYLFTATRAGDRGCFSCRSVGIDGWAGRRHRIVGTAVARKRHGHNGLGGRR